MLRLNISSQDCLRAMPPHQCANVLDYIKNPLLLAAVDAGEPLRLFAAGTRQGSWLEVRLDDKKEVALRFWNIDSRADNPAPYLLHPKEFELPTPRRQSSPLQTENFSRTLDVIAGIASAAQHASMSKDAAPYGTIIKELGKYVPWIKPMHALAQRLHGPDTAGECMHRVLGQLNFYNTVNDSVAGKSVASPGAATNALLGMHASMHPHHKPGLYALESPGLPPSYLFVQQVHDDYKRGRISDGIHAWLDSTGMPLCYNDLKRTPLFKGSNLAHDANPAFAGLTWPPKENTKRDNWAGYVNECNTPQSRALTDTLAQATPRKLSAEEAHQLANAWLSADTIHDRWGPETLDDGGGHNTLALWGKHMANCLASQYPAEHAVLTDLMAPMTNLDTIEAWRMQMRTMTMSIPNSNTRPESYPVNSLVDGP